jgi:hypothetical protein
MMLRLLLVCLLIAAPNGGAQEPDDARLQVELPERETLRGRLPLTRVSGRASRGWGAPLDLVIALDVSESVFLPAGSDVDGDGVTGRPSGRRTRNSDGSYRAPRALTTDPGDTVFEAARASARGLLEILPRDRVRVGLLTFAEGARIRARPGSPERARAALDSLRPPSEPRATDLGLALRVGTRLLRAGHADGRRRMLLFFSDGHATRPASPGLAAHREARSAAREGIAIHAVSVGPAAAGPASTYAALAALSGGIHAQPGDLEALLVALRGDGAPLPLAEVEIANVTTGERGRALRLLPDGSFDAFVRLTPGRNQLAVDVRALDGTRLSAVRTVSFDRRPEASAGDFALARTLELRALEIELAGLAAGGKRLQRRLEIGAER